MGEVASKAINVMILEKDGLMRRALKKILSDELPPGVEIAVAGDDVLHDRKAAEKFVGERTPEYWALIGIQSGGDKTHGGGDNSQLLRIVFETSGVCEALPRPILIACQPLDVLKEFHGGEKRIQEASLYYFLQLPLKVRELVCLLTYGEVFSD